MKRSLLFSNCGGSSLSFEVSTHVAGFVGNLRVPKSGLKHGSWSAFPNGIHRGAAIALLASWALMAGSVAAAMYDESVNGDLPNDPTSPALFELVLGTNSISGTLGGAAGTDRLDVISMTVPAGGELTVFTNSLYFGSNNQDFIGFHSGTPFAGSTFESSSYMGLAHFGTAASNAGVGIPSGSPTSTVGLNLLPVMNSEGLAVGASGFTSPLGPGTYTFVIGELMAELDGFPTYQFDVTVVPEPGSPWMAATGAVLLSALAVPRIRRRKIFYPRRLAVSPGPAVNDNRTGFGKPSWRHAAL